MDMNRLPPVDSGTRERLQAIRLMRWAQYDEETDEVNDYGDSITGPRVEGAVIRAIRERAPNAPGIPYHYIKVKVLDPRQHVYLIKWEAIQQYAVATLRPGPST